jgi:hypothetical protein
VLAGGETRAVALADDPAGLVDERQRAADMVAEDREQRRRAPPFENGAGEPLVHLERPFHARELLVGDSSAR